MCSSTICSWSSFAADHRDTMENPHVPKGVCVTLGTYDALYARLYCRLEIYGKGARVYCLIASRLDYTEMRRTQGLWIQLPGRRGWAMFDHLKSRSVDTCWHLFVGVSTGSKRFEWGSNLLNECLASAYLHSLQRLVDAMVHGGCDMHDPTWSNIAERYGLVDAYSSHANVTAEDVFRGWPIEQHEGRVWFLFGALWRAPWRQDINMHQHAEIYQQI